MPAMIQASKPYFSKIDVTPPAEDPPAQHDYGSSNS